MSATTPVPSEFDDALRRLRGALAGEVLQPAEPGFDDACASWNPERLQHPRLVVIPSDAADVAHAVRFARTTRLPVAVRATGHGVASPADGPVLIVTERLRTAEIDPATRTASVGAGARWCDLLPGARRHGLTGLVGTSADVGVVGYTLGGGMGWLARRYGLASDGVLAIELVTPDALLVTVTADRHPELFWALKGGGAGSLGVVTAMEIELHAVPTVYAGNLTYPIGAARDVIERWRDWVAGVRSELTSHVVVDTDRVMVRGCWSGDLAAGRALLDEWRTWRVPDADDWVVRATDELDVLAAPDGVSGSVDLTNEWVSVVRDEVIDALLDAVRPGYGGGVAWAGVRHVGGAVRARSEAAVNGAGRRDAFLVQFGGGTLVSRSAVRRRLEPYVTGSTFLNLVDGDERRQRTATSFAPEQLARLRAVKRAIDPDDRFRHGIAIGPEPAPTPDPDWTAGSVDR